MFAKKALSKTPISGLTLTNTHRWGACVVFFSFGVLVANMSVVPVNIMDKFIQNRRALIVAGLAATFAGLGALRYILLKSIRRYEIYSRTAEIACLCRCVTGDLPLEVFREYTPD